MKQSSTSDNTQDQSKRFRIDKDHPQPTTTPNVQLQPPRPASPTQPEPTHFEPIVDEQPQHSSTPQDPATPPTPTPLDNSNYLTSKLRNILTKSAMGRRIAIQYSFLNSTDALEFSNKYKLLGSILDSYYHTAEFTALHVLYQRNLAYFDSINDVHDLVQSNEEQAIQILSQLRKGKDIFHAWNVDTFQFGVSNFSLLELIVSVIRMDVSALSTQMLELAQERTCTLESACKLIDSATCKYQSRMKPFLQCLSIEEDKCGIMKQFQVLVSKTVEELEEWKSWICRKVVDSIEKAKLSGYVEPNEKLLKLLQDANVIVSNYKIKDIREKKGILCNCDCLLVPDSEVNKVCGFKKAQIHFSQLQNLWSLMEEEIQKSSIDLGTKVIGYGELELVQDCLLYLNHRISTEAKRHETLRTNAQSDWTPVDNLIRAKRIK
jgi:hypothetical protein